MSNLFVEAALFIGLPVVLLLFFFQKKSNGNNSFLALSVLTLWYSLLVNNLNTTGEIIKYPYLFRTAKFAAYLVLPFLYIYIRNTFYPGIFWRKRDWLFLMPALIYLIDLSPFFFSSNDHKIEVIKVTIYDPNRMSAVTEGLLGIRGFHNIANYLWAIFIMVLQFRLIIRNWNFEPKESKSENRTLFWFIVILSLIYIPLVGIGLIGVLFGQKWYSLQFINIDLAATVLVIALFMLISPHILYGFIAPSANQRLELKEDEYDPLLIGKGEAEPEVGDKELPNLNQHPETWALIIERINLFMEQNKPFLNQGYTIHNLSADMEIPVYQLSPIINNYFNSNFSSWLNKYRVNYFIELCLTSGKKEMTFDALSFESGFSNRVTFIKAFKKEKGTTPGAFLKEKVNA